MADGDKNKKPQDPMEERYKYIGFGVFPGKAGDMFKSESERQSWVEKVRAKLARSEGEVRDKCTLIESRVSSVEKIFLTLAAVVMIAGLFIPWFSGYIPVSYTELGSYGDYSFYYASKEDQASISDLAQALKIRHDRKFASNPPAEAGAETPPAQPAVVPDSTVSDSAEAMAETGETNPPPQPPAEDQAAKMIPAEINVIFLNTPDIDQIHGLNDLRKYAVAELNYNAETGRENLTYGANELISTLGETMLARARQIDSISAAVTDSLKQATMKRIAEGDSTVSVDSVFYAGPVLVENKPPTELAQKGIINDSYSMTGLGALISIGNYGSMIFSSGMVLVITGILLILYFLSCLVMAILNLYLLYGVRKKGEDQYVIYLKRMLRYNWIPVIIWVVMLVLSFAGASYGFDSSGMLKQIGDSYGIATFIGLSSFGIYITLGAFLITALKGKEI